MTVTQIFRTRTHEPLTGRKQVFPVEALSFSEYVKTVPLLSSLPALNAENYGPYIGALNDALRNYGFMVDILRRC